MNNQTRWQREQGELGGSQQAENLALGKGGDGRIQKIHIEGVGTKKGEESRKTEI